MVSNYFTQMQDEVHGKACRTINLAEDHFCCLIERFEVRPGCVLCSEFRGPVEDVEVEEG